MQEAGGLTYNSVKRVVKDKGYAFFEQRNDMNLIAIRGPNLIAGDWDDTLCVLYKDENGSKKIKIFDEFTTDPGSFYLRNPAPCCTGKGTAIVKPGQYRGLWMIGTHKGYPALQQKKPITVYRDNNRDNRLDMEGTNSKLESDQGKALFGINLHHGGDAGSIGRYSAGCLVLRYRSDLEELLDICQKQVDAGLGNSFTLTLIKESDLNL